MFCSLSVRFGRFVRSVWTTRPLFHSAGTARHRHTEECSLFNLRRAVRAHSDVQSGMGGAQCAIYRSPIIRLSVKLKMTGHRFGLFVFYARQNFDMFERVSDSFVPVYEQRMTPYAPRTAHKFDTAGHIQCHFHRRYLLRTSKTIKWTQSTRHLHTHTHTRSTYTKWKYVESIIHNKLPSVFN